MSLTALKITYVKIFVARLCLKLKREAGKTDKQNTKYNKMKIKPPNKLSAIVSTLHLTRELPMPREH